MKKSSISIILIISFITIGIFKMTGILVQTEIKHLFTEVYTGVENIKLFSNFRELKNYLQILFTVYIMFLGMFIFLESRDPSKTIAWLLILITFPYIGFIFYILMGQDIRKKRIFKRKRNFEFEYFKRQVEYENYRSTNHDLLIEKEPMVKKRLINLMMNNANAPFTLNNQAKVLTNGEETFDEIFKELEKATHHIHMEYFIIKKDKIGRKVFDILKRKAAQGVIIRVIYDSVGSFKLGKKYINELRKKGINMEPFLPVCVPVLSRELNYRNHRKVLIIDGAIGFLGGINIGDEYLGLDKHLGFWRDSHLKIKGNAVYELQNIFQKDWMFVTKNPTVFSTDYYPNLNHCGNHLLQIVSSGPDSDWESIMQAYFCIISSAQKHIWINTPYLVPGESIMTALKTAALSGIDVKIILPYKPDHKTVFWASMSNVEELLEAGVEIYQYEKGFIHSKVILVDSVAASVGTANLDVRSFRLNFEVNALIYDKHLIEYMETEFNKDLEDSRQIILHEHKKRGIISRIKESTGKLFSPLL